MYKHHIKILCCNKCGSMMKLVNSENKSDYIEKGLLKCIRCSASISIESGIPRYDEDSYAANFSKQWYKFFDFEKYYDVGDMEYYSTGLGLKPSDVRNKKILEIGCGNGRAVKHFLTGKPKLFVAIDLSRSVEIVEKRFKKNKNLLILQCDMNHLPFKEKTFDVVFSYGVVHHTPRPREYFLKISKFVASKGNLSIWVYPKGRNNGIISNFVQKNSYRIPYFILVIFCWIMTIIGYGLYLLSRVSFSFNFYNWLRKKINIYFRITPSRHLMLNFLWAHDFHTTRYTFEFEKEEVFKWFKHAGFIKMKALRPCGVIGIKKY